MHRCAGLVETAGAGILKKQGTACLTNRPPAVQARLCRPIGQRGLRLHTSTTGESRGASFTFTSRGIHAVAVSLNQMGMDRGNKVATLTGRVNDERFETAGYGRHRAH